MYVDAIFAFASRRLINTLADVAEENLEPTHFSTKDVEILHREFTDLPLIFEGVEFGEMRERLLLSPDSMRTYPDDDHYGSDWITFGDAVQDSFDSEPQY